MLAERPSKPCGIETSSSPKAARTWANRAVFAVTRAVLAPKTSTLGVSVLHPTGIQLGT